jgi:hypothetical protein
MPGLGFASEEAENKHETQLQKTLFDPEFGLHKNEVSDFSDLFGLSSSASGSGGGGGGFSSLLDTASFLNKVGFPLVLGCESRS